MKPWPRLGTYAAPATSATTPAPRTIRRREHPDQERAPLDRRAMLLTRRNHLRRRSRNQPRLAACLPCRLRPPTLEPRATASATPAPWKWQNPKLTASPACFGCYESPKSLQATRKDQLGK